MVSHTIVTHYGHTHCGHTHIVVTLCLVAVVLWMCGCVVGPYRYMLPTVRSMFGFWNSMLGRKFFVAGCMMYGASMI